MRLLFLFLLLPFSLAGQDFKLVGRIISELQHPIEGATISLKDFKTKQILGTTVSNSQGVFSTAIRRTDSLLLEVSHLGYASYSEVLSEEITDSLVIELQAKGSQLEEVAVTRKLPPVVRKVDRLVFHVENSNLSSLNSWEVLKKTPLVNVLGNSISVRGNSNIQVLINDKPIQLSGEELKALLESNNGSDIHSIEVITNPPAKYEASGAAIINIKMRANQLYGYKGVLTGRYTQSDYVKKLVGINNFLRFDKWNIRGSYNFISGTYARYGTEVIQFPEEQTEWKTELSCVDHAKKQSSFSFGADYHVDTTLTLSVGLDGYYDPKTYGYYDVPTIISSKANPSLSEYQTYNDHIRTTNNINLYLQLSKVWSEEKKLDWTNYISYSKSTHWQDVLTHLNFADLPKDTAHFATDNSNDIAMYASQLDFLSKWKGAQWEYGAKYSFVNMQSDLQFQEAIHGMMQDIPGKSSVFDYQEHNIAAYISSSFSYKQWQWKAGLRAEQTLLKGAVAPGSETLEQDYLTFFLPFTCSMILRKLASLADRMGSAFAGLPMHG